MTKTTPLPRSEDEIVAEFKRRSAQPFDFGAGDILVALPYEKAKPFLREDFAGEWVVVGTVEAVRKEMADYAAFAWGKVDDHRGLSSGRNLDHYASWCWLLGDDETVAFIRDDKNYPQYGAPALAYVCKKYGLFIPDDAGVQRMIAGEPCTDGCESGCGR